MKRKLRIKFNKWLVMFLFMGGALGLNAQNLEVTGVISEAGTGELLIGATVQQKGTTSGTVSDVSGKYKISVPKGTVLIFSLIGYTTQQVTVEKAGPLDISMKVQVTTLNDIIVIGYSTQKKSDKTGAVSTVKSEELNGGVLTDPIQALQGKAAGVSITKQGGDPNGGFSVRIRGASGYDANTQPLYVIDGIPNADPTIVSPDDIESYNNIIQIPLGYMDNMFCKQYGLDYPKKSIADRKLIWSFVGNPHNPDRILMLDRFKCNFDSDQYFNGFNKTSVEMLDIYNNSVFVPSPRGQNVLDCFRLYEAIFCGAIPIVSGNIDEVNSCFYYGGNKPPFIFCTHVTTK